MGEKPEYRIDYKSISPGSAKKSAVLKACNEAEAIQKFFEARSHYRVSAISVLPDKEGYETQIAHLKREIADRDAKIDKLI